MAMFEDSNLSDSQLWAELAERTGKFYTQEINLILAGKANTTLKDYSFRLELNGLWQQLNRVSIEKCKPKVKQTIDGFGKKYWEVYEPITGQSLYLVDEAEVSLWRERCSCNVEQIH
ncbi:MAG: hypothetical protein AB1589_01775 [Cyanobacteriota bacterium]